MSTIQEAIRSVQGFSGQFKKALERHRGFLGDGAGTVYVADRDGYVYVRHRQAESADITGDMEPEEVLYSRADIPPIEGYPVIFGRDLDTESFQILAHDNDQLLGWIFDNYIKDHHEQHEFNEYDTVWIQKQAMLPLLVHPTSPVSTLIQVYAGWYQWDTDWHYFETVTSAELSSYVPTGAGQARFLLICIDGDTETLHYEAGDTFLEFMPPRDCEDRIPPPPEGKIPLAAIYLVVGETSFDWDIIYDVRLLFSGGGSMSTGSAPRDAVYVTLAYNDTLSAERLLTAGHGIIVTDNGPNDTVEISVDSAADYNWSGDHNFNVGEMGLPSGTSFPASPQDGDIFYRTDEDNVYVYDGAGWVEVGILVHNELTGLQGGQANEYYHFTQAQHTSFTVVAEVGSALVCTGVNVWGADLTPLWMGTHTWGSGFAVMPTDATGQDLGDATHRWDLHTQAICFEGATNNNTITIPNNIAIALKVLDSDGLEYLRVNSEDANPYFLIDPAGVGVKVGIGHVVPTTIVHISGTGTKTFFLESTDSWVKMKLAGEGTGNTGVVEFYDLGSTHRWQLVARATDHASQADDLIYAYYDGAAWHDWIYFQDDGKVGIRCAPDTTLHMHEKSSAANYLTITNDTTGQAGADGFVIGIDGAERAMLNNREATDLVLCTTGVERMRIESYGYINITLANVPIYANNAAAAAGGLTAGHLYRTGGDPDPVCITH